jgi:hypothetical protein
MDTQQFGHTIYGALVREFGHEAKVSLESWDQLPGQTREKWISAFAGAHRQIFPHGDDRPAAGSPKLNSKGTG